MTNPSASDADLVYPLDTEGLRQKSVRGAAVTSASQALRFVLLLGSQILMARLLMPADFGIVAMVSPIQGFIIVLADLGVVQSIVQRPQLTRGQLNSFFWINSALVAAMTLLLMLMAPLLAIFYHEPRLVSVTLALASLVLVTGLTVQQVAILNRTMRYTTLAISEGTAQTLMLAVSVFTAWRGFGYWSLVMGQATATFTTAIIAWSTSRWRPSWPSVSAGTMAMLKFGGGVSVSNIALYLNSVLDNVIVGYYLHEIALGLYDRAYRLAVMPLTQLTAPINRVAVPALSRIVDEPARYQSAFSQMLRMLLFFATPGLAVAVLAAKPMVAILFGPRWTEVAPVFAWLCLGQMLTPLNVASFWLFISQGRSRDQMIFGTAAVVANLIAYLVGIHWGLLGVASVSAVSAYFIPTPLLFWAAARTGPVTRTFYLKIILPFILATLGAMAAIKLYDNFIGIERLVDLMAVGVIAYAAAAIVLSVFPSGRGTLRSALSIRKALAARHN